MAVELRQLARREEQHGRYASKRRRHELTLDRHDIVVDLLNRVSETGTGVDGVERFEPQRHDRRGVPGVVLSEKRRHGSQSSSSRASVKRPFIHAKHRSGLTQRMYRTGRTQTCQPVAIFFRRVQVIFCAGARPISAMRRSMMVHSWMHGN